MPGLKNPHQLKMANGGLGGSGCGSSRALILEKENPAGANPFEEDLETDGFLGGLSPSSRGDPDRGLFSGGPEGHYRRRATLERLVGLSPFRLGKKGGEKRPPRGERSPDRPSFLERMMVPLTEGGLGPWMLERRKPRRCSEDFSLLQRLNGRHKGSLCGSDFCLAEKENGGGGGEAAKRLSFLKVGLGGKVRRASLVEKLNHLEAPAKAAPPAKEPLSVLEILHLIHQRDLLTADQHMIELEAECPQCPPQAPESQKDESRKAKDVALLYEALQKELWAVLEESLAATSRHQPLEHLVQVIEQEEEADRQWLGARGDSAGPRPRRMKEQWAEAVDRLVGQRLQQCQEGRGGSLASQMDRLAKCAVEDLSTVKSHLHAYPKAYGAFGVYLGSFHRGLARCLAEAVRKPLSIAELYFVLEWNSNTYQREVLSRAEISSLVKPQELSPLLDPETQLSLEEDCLDAVKVEITQAMGLELQKEEARWAQEEREDPALVGFASNVILVLKAHADRASQISEDFGRRLSLCCLASLAEFLQSFQRKVEKFHESQLESGLSPDSYLARTIAQVNCCPPFRECLEHLAGSDGEALKQLAGSTLDRVVGLCNRVLADQLFQSLRPYFDKLMKRKWLSNSGAFSSIMALLAEHAQKLQKMKREPYQVLVRDVHRRLLIEYVRPLMRVRILCSSSRMRAKLAGRLRSEAKQLQEFFAPLEATSSWLDSVVPHLAGIIELQDTPAIQMEVGFLARDFPDVQKKHVSAILDVRGLRSQAQRQDVLAALESLGVGEAEAAAGRDRAFFSEIPTREVLCVRVQLHRLSHLGHACISRLHRRSQRPLPRRQRRQGKEAEAQL